MELAFKCHFVMGFPSGSPEIPKVETLATLGAHNFVHIPLIEVDMFPSHGVKPT
jgi:hypothetical protein